MSEVLLPAALGLAVAALMLGRTSLRCTLWRHDWRARGPAVQCRRCAKRIPIYPMRWSKR